MKIIRGKRERMMLPSASPTWAVCTSKTGQYPAATLPGWSITTIRASNDLADFVVFVRARHYYSDARTRRRPPRAHYLRGPLYTLLGGLDLAPHARLPDRTRTHNIHIIYYALNLSDTHVRSNVGAWPSG